MTTVVIQMGFWKTQPLISVFHQEVGLGALTLYRLN